MFVLILLPNLRRNPSEPQRSAAILIAVLVTTIVGFLVFDLSSSVSRAGPALYALAVGCVCALVAAFGAKTTQPVAELA